MHLFTDYDLDEKSGDMDPREWGWKEERGKYIPLLTDNSVAPEFLLNIIRCTCKTGFASTGCWCVKHGKLVDSVSSKALVSIVKKLYNQKKTFNSSKCICQLYCDIK